MEFFRYSISERMCKAMKQLSGETMLIRLPKSGTWLIEGGDFVNPWTVKAMIGRQYLEAAPNCVGPPYVLSDFGREELNAALRGERN